MVKLNRPKAEIRIPQTIRDEVPKTEQGIILYKGYAENTIKQCKLTIGRMEKAIVECDRRLEAFKTSKGF